MKLNTIKVENNDYHQSLLNVGYDEWRQHNDWNYSDMLSWVQEQYGDIAKFAIQVGRYNQQVENGGHLQYFYNGYGSKNSDDMEEFELHEELVEYMETLPEVQSLKHRNEVANIMSEAFPEYDTEAYFEEYVEDEDGEMYWDNVENDNYGCITNDYELDKCDGAYYKINKEWLEELEELFRKLMTS